MTRNPPPHPHSRTLAQNSPKGAGPSDSALLSTSVRTTLGRVPMTAGIALGAAATDRTDNRLASCWQAPKVSTARGRAQIDAQQTLFAALKTAAQRRAG